MTMKTQQLKTYGMQQKQSYEGSLQQYNPTSRKTSNRQLNFTSKTTGKRRTKKKKKTPKLVEGKKS